MASKNISVCGRCSREVYHAEQRLAINKVWHAFCFSCAICNKLLDSCSINPYNGEIYCATCFQQESAYDYDFDEKSKLSRSEKQPTKKEPKQEKPPKKTKKNPTPDANSTHKLTKTPDKKPEPVKSPIKDKKGTTSSPPKKPPKSKPQNLKDAPPEKADIKNPPKNKHPNLDESGNYHLDKMYQSPPTNKNGVPVRKDSSGNYELSHFYKTSKKKHEPFDDSDGYHIDKMYQPPEKYKDGIKVRNAPSDSYNIAGLFKTVKTKHEPFDESDGYHLDKIYKIPEKPKGGNKLKNVHSEDIAGLYKTPRKTHEPFDDSDGYHLDKMYKSPEKPKNGKKLKKTPSGNYGLARLYKTPKNQEKFDDSDGYHLDKMYQSEKTKQDDSGNINQRRLFKTPKKMCRDQDDTDNYYIPCPGKAQKDQKNTRNQNFMDEADNYHIKDMYRTPEKPYRGQPKTIDSELYETAVDSTQSSKTPRKNNGGMDNTENYNNNSLYPSPQHKDANRAIILNSPRTPKNKPPQRNDSEEFYHTANYPSSPNKPAHDNDDLYKTAISHSPGPPRNMSPNRNTSEEFYQTANYQKSPNRAGADLYKTAIPQSTRTPRSRSPNRNITEEFYQTPNYPNPPNRTDDDHYKTATSPRTPRNRSPNRNTTDEYYQTPNYPNSPNRTGDDHYNTAQSPKTRKCRSPKCNNSEEFCRTGNSPNITKHEDFYETAPRSPNNKFLHHTNSKEFYRTANFQDTPNRTNDSRSPRYNQRHRNDAEEFYQTPTYSNPKHTTARTGTHSPQNYRDSPNMYQTGQRSPKKNINEPIYDSATQLPPKKFDSTESDEFFQNVTTSTPLRSPRYLAAGYATVPLLNQGNYKCTNDAQDDTKKKGFFSRWFSRIIDRDKKCPENSQLMCRKYVHQCIPDRYKYVRYPMDEIDYYDNTHQHPEEKRYKTLKPFPPQHNSYRPLEKNYGWDQRDVHADVPKSKPPHLRNPMDDTKNYNIDRLHETPEQSPRGNPHMDDSSGYYIDKNFKTTQQDNDMNTLLASPPNHRRSSQRNPMDATVDHNLKQLYTTPDHYKNKLDIDPNRVHFNPNIHSTPVKKHTPVKQDTKKARGKPKYGSEVGYSVESKLLEGKGLLCKSSCDSKDCYIPTPREISGYYSRRTNQRYCNSCFPEFDNYDPNSHNNDICKRCNRMVYIVEKVKAGGNCYHDCCFTCYICHSPLNSLNMLSRRGEVFCKHCYLKYFGPQTYGFGMLPNLSL